MIVRRRKNQFVLIAQHDHALISGEFAAHFAEPFEHFDSTVYAISHHDVAWVELDQAILWNEAKNQPYSFEDYPLAPKLAAYTKGISQVEETDRYAGMLCSKHYASFFEHASDPAGRRFREQELARQNNLLQRLSAQEKESVDSNFRLLQFCDDLSLAICLNEPQQNTHPWYADGIRYQGERYRWVWEDEHRLRLTPNLFAKPFIIEIPCRIVDDSRNVMKRDVFRYQILV
ncbi:DUF3891 family protein [Lihuaxuella thermophila]|uniref:DUF3891 family protein n=1 Tax=Lihuaxuella thermophila TaxID=1173111 RepID=A0A1H8HFG4_9BACL|nr:DUF3891 family protein [Lihuaxuella thermophila]SEN54982.1 Protein of unknown function [Lihuaxuella thermophila]